MREMCLLLGFQAPRIEFDLDDVPANLREFAPYAEIWGEYNIDRRCDLVDATPRWLRKHVPEAVLVPGVQDRFDAGLLDQRLNVSR